MDTNEGAGGSYVVDAKTGERVLVERTRDAEQAPKPAPEKVQKPIKYKDF